MHSATACGCAGARIKVMRCAGFGPVVPFSYSGRKAFDAGIGLNMDLQGAGLAPSVRVAGRWQCRARSSTWRWRNEACCV